MVFKMDVFFQVNVDVDEDDDDSIWEVIDSKTDVVWKQTGIYILFISLRKSDNEHQTTEIATELWNNLLWTYDPHQL